MIKKIAIALGTIATTAGLLAAAPAQARPHEVCKRIWVHHHQERSCHVVHHR